MHSYDVTEALKAFLSVESTSKNVFALLTTCLEFKSLYLLVLWIEIQNSCSFSLVRTIQAFFALAEQEFLSRFLRYCLSYVHTSFFQENFYQYPAVIFVCRPSHHLYVLMEMPTCSSLTFLDSLYVSLNGSEESASSTNFCITVINFSFNFTLYSLLSQRRILISYSPPETVRENNKKARLYDPLWEIFTYRHMQRTAS